LFERHEAGGVPSLDEIDVAHPKIRRKRCYYTIGHYFREAVLAGVVEAPGRA
jgi:hypothetical protein